MNLAAEGVAPVVSPARRRRGRRVAIHRASRIFVMCATLTPQGAGGDALAIAIGLKANCRGRVTMAMAIGGGKEGVMVDMNLTPLIDVLLVLIIIFMVLTPLTPLGLDALVPQPNPNQHEFDQGRTIVVSIDATRQVKINQVPVDIRVLGSRLEDIFKTRNERIMLVKGDDVLPLSDVALIIDIAKGAGVDKIGLITQKVETRQ